MFRLMPAQPSHAQQIIHYLTITCYWKEFAEGNLLGLTYEEFMLQWVVNPRLPITTVLVKGDDENKIYGCVIAATTERLASMPDYTPHMHPNALKIFQPWLSFPLKDSVVLELFAVDPELRGQGYGAKLYQVVADLASREQKDVLCAFVWSFFPDSLVTLTRRGFMVMNAIEFASPVNLPLLYLEKNPDCEKFKDHFQSEQYLSTKNLLLTSA
jgi:GNAT superfamily N-acetyltransferase